MTLFPVKALMKYENIIVMDHLIIEVKNDRVGLGSSILSGLYSLTTLIERISLEDITKTQNCTTNFSLNIMSDMFLLFCFLSLNNCIKLRENVSHFTSKDFFII